MDLIKFLYIFLLLTPFVCNASVVTTLSIVEKDGVTTNNYPLTFGHSFKTGDVHQYVQVRYNGTLLNTQCDVKSTYITGSVRFAIVSVVLPSVVGNSTNTISLETSSTNSSSGYMDKSSILSTNIEDEIRLTNISGSGYSGSLTADLNNQISLSSNLSYWLQGSISSEILVRQILNNSLESSWEVRYYPGTSFGPRISHSIENINADYRGIVNYDVDIQAGLPTLSSKYSKSSIQHNENSRWRKVFWIGNEPPETELHYDLAYLISTGAVMSYDTSLVVPELTLSGAYSTWVSSDHDIMGSGTLEKEFPTTGGREDIGVLPTWSARYLLTMDNRMKEIVISNGEMAAHCPIHYRESNAAKSFYRHPVSIDDRPTVFTTEEYASAYGSTNDKLPSAIGNVGSTYHGWTIDRAHQGSFAYLPYLITGERYFLDEMYYWASYNLSGCWDDPTYGRNLSNGWIQDQVRGEAWAFRNIVDAAAYGKDNDPEKEYLSTKINNNISQWMSEKDRYPLNYWGIDAYASTENMTSIVQYVTSPWMEDYMLLSLSHAKEQGFLTKQIIDWYNSYIIGRFTQGSSWTPYDGVAYRLPTQLTDNSYPASWDSVYTMLVNHHSSLTGVDQELQFIALAALSTVKNYTGGQSAYNFLVENVTNKTLLNSDPTWAINTSIVLSSSCSDGIQNGDETGIDCGGSCSACATPPSSFRPWAIGGRVIAPSGRPIASQTTE